MKTLFLSLTLLLAAPAFAQEAGHAHAPAALETSGAFIRATLPRAPVGGAYLTIVNSGPEDDRLLAVTSPVGAFAAIHEMAHADGVMSMRPLPEGLPIPAGETVSLKPGGYHIMIEGLTAPLVEGETLDLTLTFEKAGEIPVSFDILAINARSHPAAAAPAHEGGHGHD
ncbi:copper chaperone PCu(A)C [Neomegalonema perideroedes]|uniref:copper chaperone PCu(A)C n=1 Tax=Neomegalonema perideroedes TaxID=217219 RepID=UPI00037C1C71|nr:copper chaperone PCu(A)C [Neomegalonema perideroedes]